MSKIALRIDRERLPRPGEAERSRRMLGQWTERARSLGGETAVEGIRCHDLQCADIREVHLLASAPTNDLEGMVVTGVALCAPRNGGAGALSDMLDPANGGWRRCRPGFRVIESV